MMVMPVLRWTSNLFDRFKNVVVYFGGVGVEAIAQSSQEHLLLRGIAYNKGDSHLWLAHQLMAIMAQITIQVSDELVEQLQPFRDRLPEVLERGLGELSGDTSATRLDEQEIMVLLASQPTPQEILAIRPSEALQQRVSELLAKRKGESLSVQEETELERHLTVEHLVRLAKTNAYAQLKQAS